VILALSLWAAVMLAWLAGLVSLLILAPRERELEGIARWLSRRPWGAEGD